MSSNSKRGPWRVIVLSVVKHDYIARAFAAHQDFELVAVSEGPGLPAWVHERNRKFADEFRIPYQPNWAAALEQYAPDVAIVSSEAERHVALSLLAIEAGVHVVQDKPMATELADCDALVSSVAASGLQFMMWNRSALPAIRSTHDLIRSGRLGRLQQVHVDFYFAKDAGPPLGSVGPNHTPVVWLEALQAAHASGADGSVGQRPMGELECEGIYPLAYVLLLTGERFVRVHAHAKAHFHQLHADHHVDDLAAMTLEMTRGVRATVCLGRIGNASHPDLGEIKLHVIGEKSSCVVRESAPEVAIDYRNRTAFQFRHQRLQNDNDWLLAERFSQALKEGSPADANSTQATALLNAEDSRHIFATIAAAQASARSRTAVQVGA
ncbi:MAG: Gfo/Idh/MocA family oxidoreductase [Planctomycetales bacterium]|nr:Gfo/Idh/MocA family oxidoreductase [Planctomycetales bacterium]